MTCPRCQHENRAGAKFCEECAAPLPRPCASCGAHLRASAKFCDECGTATGAAPVPTPAAAADGTRKVVTVVFADLAGSTALHERLDAESARRFMDRYYEAMRAAVDAHGGIVTQLLGDGVKAVFGAPHVAEDDAVRAVRAAVAMQRAFRALAAEQRGAAGAGHAGSTPRSPAWPSRSRRSRGDTGCGEGAVAGHRGNRGDALAARLAALWPAAPTPRRSPA